MKRATTIIDVLKIRPALKLTLMSSLLTLIIAVILAVGSYLIISVNEVIVLEGNLSSLPALVEEQASEIERQFNVYNGDYICRGELATRLYNEFEGIDAVERMRLACENIDALNITLLNGEGAVIATTAEGQPSEVIADAFANTKDDSPLYDPNLTAINEEKVFDEDGYDPEDVSLPMVYRGITEDGDILMVEFDYTSFGKAYVSRVSTEEICRRVLAGMEGYAFIEFNDGTMGSYSSVEQTDAEKSELLTQAKTYMSRRGIDYNFELSDQYDTSYMTGKLGGKMHLLVKLSSPDLDYKFMLAIPVSSFVNSMVMCDVTILVLIVVGFFLFSNYATRVFRQNPVREEDKRLYARQARTQTMAGAAVLIIVTGALTTMLFMLESMSNTAQLTMTQQESIRYEVEYREQRKSDISEDYSKRYTTRARALAFLLSGHPELRTRKFLQRLNNAVKAEYLMVFDKDGNELFSTNGFVGFTFADESSGVLSEWKPVLTGYEQVETPTQKNPVTGQYERTIATSLKDAEDLPDGMLVMVVDDDEYVAEIGDASVEGVIKNFVLPAGQVACVVDNETGLFIAHTDGEKVDEPAEKYLNKDILGRDFEGYTVYGGKEVYASGLSYDGKTALVLSKDSASALTKDYSWFIIFAILLLMLLIFYPAAATHCAQYARLRTDLKKADYTGHPLLVFFHGYVGYLALLALMSFLASLFGVRTAVEFVYDGKWTPGLHVFSIWAALFMFTLFSYTTLILHRIVRGIERAGSTRTKTFARIIDSFITYVLAVVTVICILTTLGVNTFAIIGSISIVSIAVGMGTQDLVKDIVAGLFLVFEDTVNVGDVVEIGSWRGRVTDMGIRTTEITNEHNDVKIVTNSHIGDLVNYSKVKTLCTEEFVLPRTVKLDRVPDLVDAYIERVVRDIPELKDSLGLDEVMGISESSYTVRLSYTVNETERESVTLRLRNTMQLLLESGDVAIKSKKDDADDAHAKADAAAAEDGVGQDGTDGTDEK